MSFTLSFFLFLSLVLNGILIWYVKKIIKNLNAGVESIDDFQKLLEEYCSLMESVNSLEEYYGDDTIVAAIKNTKVVIEAAKSYKKNTLNGEEEAFLIDKRTE